ncbi:MAG: hypothetical protein HKM07_05950 [Chlamydiae bacterium]|jgi:GR25 family glycosyltransferase involved in LPS biosynthesis|nr:hypothetical protein [Chlamydiota bacterium]
MDYSGFNMFDGIVYINLDHRKDRKKELLAELNRLQVRKEKIHRINAFYDSLNGHRGCALSHSKAIEFAIQKKWKNVLILEDDFTATKTIEEINPILEQFTQDLKNDWDVFLIGGNIRSYEPTQFERIRRSLSATCGHAYVVNSHYFEKLKILFLSAYDLMQNDFFFFHSRSNAFDQRWDVLMQQDRWYFIEIFAQQRVSYSDIELRDKDRRYRQHFD